MNQKTLSGVVIFSIFAFLFSVSFHAVNLQADNGKDYYLTVKKINGVWKVVHSGDNSKFTVTVKRGDKITWTAEGTDCYFQFNDVKLVGKLKHGLKAGKKLKLKIGAQAKLGINYYAIFCTVDNEFAEGGSPPKLIVE